MVSEYRAAEIRRQADQLMTPAEVAAAFRVDPKTVARWAQAGRLPFIRTPGGHARFYRSDVKELIARSLLDTS